MSYCGKQALIVIGRKQGYRSVFFFSFSSQKSRWSNRHWPLTEFLLILLFFLNMQMASLEFNKFKIRSCSIYNEGLVLLCILLVIVAHIHHCLIIIQQSQCYFQCRETVPKPGLFDERCWEFFTELQMRKNTVQFWFSCYVNVEHQKLVAIQSQLLLLNVNTLPKSLNFSFQNIAHLTHYVQFLHWGFCHIF